MAEYKYDTRNNAPIERIVSTVELNPDQVWAVDACGTKMKLVPIPESQFTK